MSRYFYVLVLVLVLVGVITLFVYRTQTPPAEPAAQMMANAEFGGVSLRIDYATTTMARERGLGGRASIPSYYGMLFIFPKDENYGFWMKDMLVPIDIFWLNSQGQVISIAQDVATSSYPNVFYPSAPARYVLETFAGFARIHTIKIGTPLLLKSFPIVSE